MRLWSHHIKNRGAHMFLHQLLACCPLPQGEHRLTRGSTKSLWVPPGLAPPTVQARPRMGLASPRRRPAAPRLAELESSPTDGTSPSGSDATPRQRGQLKGLLSFQRSFDDIREAALARAREQSEKAAAALAERQDPPPQRSPRRAGSDNKASPTAAPEAGGGGKSPGQRPQAESSSPRWGGVEQQGAASALAELIPQAKVRRGALSLRWADGVFPPLCNRLTF